MTETRSPGTRSGTAVGLVVSCLLVAAVTLTPVGTGWAWGDPLEELRWYLADPIEPSVFAQWAGNALLLVVPAVCAVRLWPRLARPAAVATVAVTAASGIELAQLVLSLGRVVSPVDAALNAAGVIAAATLVRLLSTGDRGETPDTVLPLRAAPVPALAGHR